MGNRVAVVLAMALVLAACHKGTDAVKPRLGLVDSGMAPSGTVPLARLIATGADGTAELLATDAQGSRARQRGLVEAALGQKIQALLVSCVDPGDAGAFIDLAKEAKVPILFFGNSPSRSDLVRWDKAYFVGSDDAHLGRAEGELAASLWASPAGAAANRDGILQYALLVGSPAVVASADGPGPSAALDRAGGTLAALAASGIPVSKLAEEGPGWSATAAKSAAAALAARFGRRLDYILCGGEDQALGAATGLPRLPAGAVRTGIIGLGAGGEVLSAIADGRLLGTVMRDGPAEADAALALARRLAGGRELEGLSPPVTDAKYLWVPPVKVTAATLDQAQKSLGGPPRR